MPDNRRERTEGAQGWREKTSGFTLHTYTHTTLAETLVYHIAHTHRNIRHTLPETHTQTPSPTHTHTHSFPVECFLMRHPGRGAICRGSHIAESLSLTGSPSLCQRPDNHLLHYTFGRASLLSLSLFTLLFRGLQLSLSISLTPWEILNCILLTSSLLASFPKPIG